MIILHTRPRSQFIIFRAYHRLDAKKALIGMTHVAYLSREKKYHFRENWTNEKKGNHNAGEGVKEKPITLTVRMSF